jgi:hypothetical protein
VSPDSQHIAEYGYEAGFLGRDSTFVSVRRRLSFRSEYAYWYAGPSDWSGTDVRWLDNNHLFIRYKGVRENRSQYCSNNVSGIIVQCLEY